VFLKVRTAKEYTKIWLHNPKTVIGTRFIFNNQINNILGCRSLVLKEKAVIFLFFKAKNLKKF